jgi:hypothetical protein
MERMSAVFKAHQHVQHLKKSVVQDNQNDRYLKKSQVFFALIMGSEMPC